ncbi:MAG: hypothetical protein ACOX3V_01510 [Bacillota bacterium]
MASNLDGDFAGVGTVSAQAMVREGAVWLRSPEGNRSLLKAVEVS